jgi:hypothetical protein
MDEGRSLTVFAETMDEKSCVLHPSSFVYFLICPFPSTMNFVDVSSSRPMGPRA